MQQRTGMTLMRRIYLFLAAFAAALFVLVGVHWYQNAFVLEPLERQTGNISAISRFSNSVDRILGLLEDYRWDYGDSAALLAALEPEQGRAAQYLAHIGKDLAEVGETQHLLARAADITFTAFDESLTGITAALQAHDASAALAQYYARTLPAGQYLLQYTRQLLEQAISENQSAYLHTVTLKRQLQNLQMLAVAGCVVLGGVLLVLMRRLLGPVRQLAAAADRIAQGDFATPDVPADQPDEIGRLAAAFNGMKRSMANRVQLLNERNEMQQALHRRETEALEMQALVEREKLQQLRSQINPHFLFNTLGVIRYTAEQENAARTRTLLTSLASLLRYSLANNEEQVPLSQEVRIIDSLFLLYHTRFGDRMRLEWRIAPQIDLTETQIPSFLLQPLVENAFRHGLGPKEEGGVVRIRITQRDGRLHISVLDNGVGIAPERLRELRAGLGTQPENGEHIGIYNVAARLRLLGEGYGFAVYSRPGRCTRMALCLPYITATTPDTEEGA